MKHSIQTREICFAYKGKPVLAGVNFSVKPGELVGLLGPNGSGKSTFLKNILGFLEPCSGTISYSGCHGHQPAASELAQLLAFVPQQTGLRTPITVSEAVLMGRLPHLKDRWQGYSAQDRAKTNAVIEALGLWPLADRPVVCLSGGELQKVVIARCLVQESEIILLDEATAGLDLNHAVEIMELMRHKADEEKKAIIAVLHDLNLAAAFCDRIVLLKNGRVNYEGRPEHIITESVLEEIYGFRATVGIGDDGKPFVLPRRASDLSKERKLPHVC